MHLAQRRSANDLRGVQSGRQDAGLVEQALPGGKQVARNDHVLGRGGGQVIAGIVFRVSSSVGRQTQCRQPQDARALEQGLVSCGAIRAGVPPVEQTRSGGIKTSRLNDSRPLSLAPSSPRRRWPRSTGRCDRAGKSSWSIFAASRGKARHGCSTTSAPGRKFSPGRFWRQGSSKSRK